MVSGLWGRFFLSFFTHPGLNWDEAPQVLMARQIAEGRILPIVHFQLPYIGAVEQYPLALWMLSVGDGVPAIRLFYFLLSAMSIGGCFLLYRRIFPAGLANLATAMVAFCPPMILLPSLQAYSFAGLVFASGYALWLALRLGNNTSCLGAFSLGVFNGLALYNNILFAGVLLFSACLARQRVRGARAALFGTGVLLGYSPMLLFNFANDFVSYQMLAAKVFGVTQTMVDELGVPMAIWRGGVGKFLGDGNGAGHEALYAFPAFFARSGHWVQTIGFAAILIATVIGFCTLVPRWHRQLAGELRMTYDARVAFYIVLGGMIFVALGEIRYMTALIPIFPAMVCEGLILCRRRSMLLSRCLTVVVVVYLLSGHMAVAAGYDSSQAHPETYERICEFLAQRNLRYGYGSYEFQASIAYVSDEQVKISTQIGPIFMDKIPRFSQEVDRAGRVFYILPPDDAYLSHLRDEGISYRLAEVGEWWILWDFNRRVYPVDLLPREELTKPGGYNRWSYKVNPAVLNPFRGGH